MYKAFLSYSHAADGLLGPALQTALHRFARRWTQLRAIRVFRDTANLSVSPGLWSSVEHALSQSEFLILLASPAAAASKWVRREVDYWLKNKSPDTLLLVLTDGHIVWDDQAADFDWERTDSIPLDLRRVFREEPHHTDLRWVKTGDDLTLKNPAFLENVADLAATLHGKDRDALIGEDVRQHRTARRLRWAAVTALVVLAALVMGATWYASVQRQLAEYQRNVAVARRLLAAAELMRIERASFANQALLLMLESYGRDPTLETYQVLRSALSLLPRSIGTRPEGRDTRFVALSPNGQFRALRRAGSIHVVGLANDQQFGRTLPYGEDIHGAHLANDGGRLAIADAQGVVHLWDTAAGTDVAYPLTDSRCQHVRANALAFSPDSRYVALAVDDGTAVEMRRLEDNRLVSRLLNFKGCVYALALSLGGRHMAIYSLNDREHVRIADMSTLEQREMVVPHWEVRSLSFNPDGELLATASPDRTARVWQWRSGKEIALVRHPEAIREAVFSPDSRYLATTSGDRTARIWDVSDGRELARIVKDDAVSAVAFGDGDHHVVTMTSTGEMDRWDVRSAVERRRLAHEVNAGPFTIAFAAKSDRILIGASDDSVQVWDAHQGVRRVHRSGVSLGALSPDGTMLAVARTSGDIEIVDVGSGGVDASTSGPGAPYALTFADDGSRLVGSGRDGTVRVWSMPRLQEVASIRHPDVWHLVLSEAGRQLLTLTKAGALQRWQIDATVTRHNAVTVTPPAHPRAAAMSPDAKHVAIWNERQRVVQLWNADTGRLLFSVAHEAGGDRDAENPAMAFSADGRYLATATRRDPRMTEGNVITVQEINGRTQLARITTADHVSDVRFSPDGRYLATVGYGRASLWIWQPAELIAEACTRLGHSLTRDDWIRHLPDEPYRETCPRSGSGSRPADGRR